MRIAFDEYMDREEKKEFEELRSIVDAGNRKPIAKTLVG